MPKLFSIRPGLSPRGRQFKGLRGWSGKPLHPPLTDFPVVGYVLAAAFDLVSLALARRGGGLARDAFVAGTWVLVAGAVVSVATLVTGFWDWWKGIERESTGGLLGRAKHTQVWRTINWHATVMLATTGVVIADIALRLSDYGRGAASLTVTLLSVVAGLLVSLGALYGGELVYEFQFNVESLEGSTAWDETDVDQTPADRPQSHW